MTDGPSTDGTNEDGASEETTGPAGAAADEPGTEPVDDEGGEDARYPRSDDEPVDGVERGRSNDDGEGNGRNAETEASAATPDASEAGAEIGDGNSSVHESDAEADDAEANADDAAEPMDDDAESNADEPPAADADLPEDVRKYDRFKKIDGGTYDRANEFLRDRTYVTAREWAIARLCADFRTETGVEMTKIGENLPQLVPFMTDTYTPQAVNQARSSFEQKVRKSGATFLYGAMCDFFTAQELDDVMYEATEVAKFLLEVEGVELSVDEELAAEDRISEVMREVREHSAALRHDEMTCPECGHEMSVEE